MAEQNLGSSPFDEYNISGRWKRKFEILDRAGPLKRGSYKNMAELTLGERYKIGFNLLAFILGPFYYFFKGMWKKGAVLLSSILIFNLLMISSEFMFDLTLPSAAYWAPGALLCASLANYDYYRHVAHQEAMWKLLSLFSRSLAVWMFTIISLLAYVVVLLVLLQQSEMLSGSDKLTSFTNDASRLVSSLSSSRATNANRTAAWGVEETIDPMTDEKTLLASKVFLVDSIEIQAKASCSVSNPDANAVIMEFTFYIDDEAAKLLRANSLGKTLLGSFSRRIGKGEVKKGARALRYSNQIGDKLDGIRVSEGVRFVYKFNLENGEPIVSFFSDEVGLVDVLHACGHIQR